MAALAAGVGPGRLHAALRFGQYLGPDGQAGPHLPGGVEVGAHVAGSLHVGAAHLAQVLYLVLAQLAEKLLLGNVEVAEVGGVDAAFVDQQHRLALKPVAETRVPLGEAVEKPVQRAHRRKHQDDRKERRVVVNHRVAGRCAQTQDDAHLEDGELPHAAPASHAQGGQQQDVGGNGTEHHFEQVGGRRVGRPQHAVPVEGRNGFGEQEHRVERGRGAKQHRASQ